MSNPHSPSGNAEIQTKESAAHKLLADSGPIPPGTCFRDGKFLVVAGTSSPLYALLDRCIKTNEQPTERCLVTAPFGPISYRSVNIPLGKSWWTKRYAILGAAAGAVVLGMLMCAPMLQSRAHTRFWESVVQYSCYAGLVLGCAGFAIFYRTWKSVPVYPVKEEDGCTWFSGAGERLLDSLPPWLG
jgi:hypothetical protein